MGNNIWIDKLMQKLETYQNQINLIGIAQVYFASYQIKLKGTEICLPFKLQKSTNQVRKIRMYYFKDYELTISY